MRVVHPSVYLKQQERRRKKKRGRLVIPCVLLVLAGFYVYLSANVAPTYTISRTFPKVIEPSPVDIAWPASGSSAFGYVGSDGKVLASQNGDAVVPTASTIKILTALVVLDKKPLGLNETEERIYFDQTDVAMTERIAAAGGAYYPVTNGMSMTYKQALELMLIGSANNIADKLAIWAYGSTEEYLKAANTYTKAHDMLQTTVTDTSGLLSTTQSTANDMLKVSLLAMEVPIIREIANLEKTRVNGIEVLATNRLLSTDQEIDGLKTGYLPEAGYCLILTKSGTFNSDIYTFVTVVLGQPDRETSFNESYRLLTGFFTGTENQVLLPPSSHVADLRAPWGEEVRLTTRTALEGYKWAGEGARLEISVGDTKYVKKGSILGKVSYRDRSVDVLTMDELPQPSIWWRLMNGFDHLEEML